MTRLIPSRRAAAALALVVAASTGGLTTFLGHRTHDDTRLAAQFLVGPWEGDELVAYLDRLARPPVWTICKGDTTGVTPGLRETPEGCDSRLMVKMERDYRPKLVACVESWDSQPLSWRGMMLDLSWNIGTGRKSGGKWVGGACGSTAAGIVNQAMRSGKTPDYVSSCRAATLYNRAGGKVYIGLVRRREMGDASRIGEGELCVSGLS